MHTTFFCHHQVIRSLFSEHSDAQILYLCMRDRSGQRHFCIAAAHGYANAGLARLLCKSCLADNSNCIIRRLIPLYRYIPACLSWFSIPSTQNHLILKDCRNADSIPEYICRHNLVDPPDRQTNAVIDIATTQFLYTHTIRSYASHISINPDFLPRFIYKSGYGSSSTSSSVHSTGSCRSGLSAFLIYPIHSSRSSSRKF